MVCSLRSHDCMRPQVNPDVRPNLPMRILLVLGVMSSVLSEPAAAACSCLWSARPDAPRPRMWPPLDAPVLFAGRVLTIDSVAQGRRVQFVTDSSWRTPLPDTVTVEYGDDAPCAFFIAGAPYLVGAVGTLGALRLPPCGEGIALISPTLPPRLRELGAPTWRAPPLGERQLDRLANRIGARAPLGGPGDTLNVYLHTDSSAVRLDVANLTPPLHLASGRVRLPSGLYQYRVTRSDGTILESYIRLRCEKPHAGDHCAVGRNFLGRE